MNDEPRIQYKFMIPASLKERLEDAAHDKRRSLSAEIIDRLEESFTEKSEKDELSGLASQMRELRDALAVNKAARALLMAELRSAAKVSGRPLQEEMLHRLQIGLGDEKPPMTPEIFELLFGKTDKPD